MPLDSSRPIEETYFVWLYGQVGSVKVRNLNKTYWQLMRLLHSKEFVWFDIKRDGNRAQDGKDLRQHFLNETNAKVDSPDFLDLDCSFLEMLIALSAAVAFTGGGDPSDWFWQMIGNLGLLGCVDANPPEESVISDIVDRVIDRRYATNGAGGLFPLQNAEQDQRKIELWYQANAYLLERL